MSSHFGDEEYRSAATLFQSFVFFNLCNPLIYVNTQLLWQHFILHMDAYNILQMQRMFYFTHDYVQSLHSLMIIALSKHKQRNSFKPFLHHLLICYRNWCICYKMLDLEKATREQMNENAEQTLSMKHLRSVHLRRDHYINICKIKVFHVSGTN